MRVLQTLQPLDRLSREVVDVPFLKVFKVRDGGLDGGFSSMI